MQQYCKATSTLRQRIDEAIHRGASVEPVFICCILFVCFELFLGKQDNAIAHLRLGRRIVEGVGKSSLSTVKNPVRDVVRSLIATMDVLESDAIMNSRHGSVLDQDGRSLCLNPIQCPPRTFTSLEEAKEHLDALSLASYQLRTELFCIAEDRISLSDRARFRTSANLCVTHCLSRTVEKSSASPVLHRKESLDRAHDAWLAAFTSMETLRQLVPSQARLKLEIQHVFSSLTLRTCRDTMESSWDFFKDDFVHILDLAERFLYGTTTIRPEPMLDHRIGSPQLDHSFSIELGILPALAMVSKLMGKTLR